MSAVLPTNQQESNVQPQFQSYNQQNLISQRDFFVKPAPVQQQYIMNDQEYQKNNTINKEQIQQPQYQEMTNSYPQLEATQQLPQRYLPDNNQQQLQQLKQIKPTLDQDQQQQFYQQYYQGPMQQCYTKDKGLGESFYQTDNLIKEPNAKHSQIMKCINCNSVVRTETKFEKSTGTLILSGFLFLSTVILAPLPFLLDSTKDCVHYCPRCKAQIGKIEWVDTSDLNCKQGLKYKA